MFREIYIKDINDILYEISNIANIQTIYIIEKYVVMSLDSNAKVLLEIEKTHL